VFIINVLQHFLPYDSLNIVRTFLFWALYRTLHQSAEVATAVTVNLGLSVCLVTCFDDVKFPVWTLNP
jgi:hypothetical protein